MIKFLVRMKSEERQPPRGVWSSPKTAADREKPERLDGGYLGHGQSFRLALEWQEVAVGPGGHWDPRC